MNAVLFDIDGTLIDSNAQHAASWHDALAEAGYAVPAERIRPLIGMGGDKLLPAVVPALDTEREPGKTIARRADEIFLERYLGEVRATPGARALLDELARRGLRRVSATSAKPPVLEASVRHAGLDDAFDEKASSGDAERSKPDPDIIGAALQRAGVAASDAVMIGDTPYDIEAAHRAGLPAIALLCGGSDPASLAGAEAVYADPAALLSGIATSPLSFSRG